MLRHFCLGISLSGLMLLAGCGGGTGVSNPPGMPPGNGGGTQAPPTLSSSVNTLDFGDTFVGTNQGASVVLTNGSTTGQGIGISQLSVTGTGFSLVSPPTLPLTIAAGKTLTLKLNFAPTNVEPYTGSLTVGSSAVDSTLTVALTGAGLQVGALGYSPSQMQFGDVAVGQSLKLPLVLSNASGSNANIDISQLSLTGPGYSLDSPPTLPATIAPGNSLTLNVIFQPTAGGNASGQFIIDSDATNPSLTLPIGGFGLAAGELNASPASLSFGSVTTGNNSSLTGILTAGATDITVSAATVTGQYFSFSGISFPATISAGNGVPYTITFAPTAAGNFTGTVSFASNASNSPAVQNLSGTGASNGGGGGSGGGGTGGGGGGTPPGAISPDFFNLDAGNLLTPYPNQLNLHFAIWRSLGTLTRWSNLETCAGGPDPSNACYNWTDFDAWATLAATNGQDILYTAYYTPTWASSNPSAPCQTDSGPGGCYPPSDVESGDQYWKDFLTALYTHAATTPGLEKIKYWECWNEPNVSIEYNNNNSDPAVALADLNTMCSDLKTTVSALDPTAKFTTPAPASAKGVVPWLKNWIDAGYANYADYIAFHGYVCVGQGTCVANSAETILPIIIQPLEAFIASTKGTNNDVTGKLLWDTEGSDDAANIPILDPDLHAAFYARYTLVQESAGISHFSYWGYDFLGGVNLVNNPGTKGATLNTAGVAWQQVYNWTVGSAFTAPCANTSGTIWQCELTNGTNNTLIVWDTSQSCSGGVCTTSNFPAPSGYTQYQDLAGNTSGINNGTVPVGAKPVMLQ